MLSISVRTSDTSVDAETSTDVEAGHRVGSQLHSTSREMPRGEGTSTTAPMAQRSFSNAVDRLLRVASGSRVSRRADSPPMSPASRWRFAMALVVSHQIPEARTTEGCSPKESERPLSDKSRRRRRWVEKNTDGVTQRKLDDRLRERSEVRHALEKISRQSHQLRLWYSGGLLATGAVGFAAFQALGIAQAFHTGWSLEAPPVFLWPTLSQACPALMLLALRPCDRKAVRVAAVLLCSLCLYYNALLFTNGVHWGTPLACARSAVLSCIEWSFGALFLRAAYRLGPERRAAMRNECARRFFFSSSRQALDWLWLVYRATVLTSATVDLSFCLALLVWRAMGLDADETTAQPEPEAEPEAASGALLPGNGTEPFVEPEAEPEAASSVLLLGNGTEAFVEPEPPYGSPSAPPHSALYDELSAEPEPLVGEPSAALFAEPESEPAPEGEPSGGASPEPAITLDASTSALWTLLIGSLLLILLMALLSKRNRARVHSLLTRWDARCEHQTAATSAHAEPPNRPRRPYAAARLR